MRGPKILYGTAWKKSQTASLVETALQAGFRGIDTACQPKHYDEPAVGEGIAAAMKNGLQRADLFLQTKFTPLSGQDPKRIPYDPNASLADQVAQSFGTSQRNLRTTYLDSLVLHSPLADTKQLMQVWTAMEAIADAGGARQLGISNCYDLKTLKQLHRSSRVKPAVVQNRFYADTGYDREIRAFCRQNDISYQSFWTLTANPHLLRHPTLNSVATTYARTPAQTLFRYLTLEGVVPLTGTKSQTHMREDLDIFDFELTTDERAALTALLSIM